MKTCAELFAGIRDRHRWTQEQMAARLSLSRSSVANIEAGRQDPTGSTLLWLLRDEGLLVDADHPDRMIGNLTAQLQTTTALLRAAEADAARYRTALTGIAAQATEAIGEVP